jgi:poly(A) polymerase
MISFFRNLYQRLFSTQPVMLKLAKPLSIMPEVVNILNVLQKNGFEAYVVGGGVRDLLIGAQPKDFDIVTSALPHQVKKLFRHSIIIGKRFRLVHVNYSKNRNDFIEVATFRSLNKFSWFCGKNNNYYGNIATDSMRRDFSINALFYDPSDNLIIDYCKGLEDIKNKRINTIGKAASRFKEDPVRIIRAIRFAAKLEFKLDRDIDCAIRKNKKLIKKVNADRLFLDVVKLFYNGHGERSWKLLQEYQLIPILFASLAECLEVRNKYVVIIESFLLSFFKNSDERFNNNQCLSPAFLFAVLYWFPWQMVRKSFRSRRRQVLRQKMHEVLSHSKSTVALSNRLCESIVAIWELQSSFHKRRSATILRTMSHPKFKAAYDFFLLRAMAGNAPKELAYWWQEFISADKESQQTMLSNLD